MKNSINWFEIPSLNLDKAVPFYEKTLGIILRRVIFGGFPHAVFPIEKAEGHTTGALVTAPHLVPSAHGAVVYLEAPGGVAACLARAKAAGAQELQPHTAIGPNGFFAIIRDVDGNSIGLHSMTA